MARKKAGRGGGRVELPLAVEALGRDDWPTVERLFGERGACGGCWCMWWRVPKGGKTWEEAKGPNNRERFRHLVQAGDVHAVIAYVGDEPVGWCSFGPRRTFPRLERVRALRREAPEATWSIVCYYIPAAWRGRGVALRLLEAATERAFTLGASEIEGFPIVPKDAAAKVPAAFAWTGVPALFEAAGYKKMRRPGASRPIYLKMRPGTG
jgi:GNAT superfamily N-acetyltransferase